MRYIDLDDDDLCALIENRWTSSSTVWDEIDRATKNNKLVYKGQQEWWNRVRIPPTRPRVTSNRVFTNVEAVINSLIANPPKPNILPGRESMESKNLSYLLEGVLNVKYEKLNTKEVLRQTLRDLYISRLMVLKPFWNASTNDVDVKRIDPKKVRFSPTAKNEISSDFAIEEVDTTVQMLIAMFPEKKSKIMEMMDLDEQSLLINNPTCSYKEAWIGNDLCVKFKGIILWKGKNPYWDWDGLLTTREEMETLGKNDDIPTSAKIANMKKITVGDIGLPADIEDINPDMTVQDFRKSEYGEDITYESYLFNYFDKPRKPYIFATVLGNEDKPIGMTSFIEQATSLQEVVDRTVYQIYLNTEMVNGITKIDSQLTNVSKADAQNLRYDAGGVLWGKGVVNGVQREFGQGLPQMVFAAIEDYRNEIDNIMAATSAFRGEREGQETKAGRMALIDQSFLRLNEMVQVVDYVSGELFAWWLQLMKVKYTERHLVKKVGADSTVEIMELSQDDIEEGVEVRVIPGKTLPEDKRFRFERAQNDVQAGYISPLKYLEEAGYQDPKTTAREAFEFAQNPAGALGVEQAPPPGMPPGSPPMAPPGAPASALALEPQQAPVAG